MVSQCYDGNIVFEYKENKFLMELLYMMGGYFTYEIQISVKDFSGVASFCIHDSDRMACIRSIEEMLKNLYGHLIIQDCESESFLKIQFNDHGRLTVQGQIGSSYNENYLVFNSFEADQTLLIGLRRQLIVFE